MEKNLQKNFDNQNISQENNFNSIKITLASPEKIKSWSYGEIKKLPINIIALLLLLTLFLTVNYAVTAIILASLLFLLFKSFSACFSSL